MRYDPRNIARVYVRDDQGRYFTIPYRDTTLPPITLTEHRRAVKRLRAEGRRSINQDLLFQTVLQQRRLVAHAIAQTKAKHEERGKTSPARVKATRAARRAVEHTVTSIGRTRESPSHTAEGLSSPELDNRTPPSVPESTAATPQSAPSTLVQATDEHFDIEVWP